MADSARPLRVLLVSQYFWPESFYINAVARRLAGKGLQVDVLTGKPNYPAGRFFQGYKASGSQEEEYHGVRIRRLPMLSRGQGVLCLAANYLSFVLSGLLLGPWLMRRTRCDVIFVYAPSPILQAIPAIFLGWLKHRPVVLWVQDLWPESLSATGYVSNRTILSLVAKLVRFIYRHVDLLLVQSRSFCDAVGEMAPSIPVVYYPNSVEDVLDGEVGLAPLPVQGVMEGFCILFAGNIGSAQAVEVILDAAEQLTDLTEVRFVVVGDGSRREWMLAEATRRGLGNVVLPGRFPVEDMPAFMARAEALLVTLSDQAIFRQTIPSKLQSYLAAGRPILASLNGEGADLVVAAGAGLCSAAEDGNGLAENVRRLHAMSPQQRAVLGANGRCHYERHFALNVLMDELVGHLNSVGVSGQG